jgi:hypothetical protein
MLHKLGYWLQSKKKLLRDFDNFIIGSKKERRIFIDRNSDILFIAHIDTVLEPKLIKKTKHRIYAHGLDDRLGCLIASELSEQLNADLLLTDYEEFCQSTARFHTCKDYNWIAEFDRGGADVVTYSLDSKEFLGSLSEYFQIGIGSYSDICDLKTSACCMNVGIGYEFAHSKDSYVTIKKMQKQIDQFILFHNRYKQTKFEQDEKQIETYYPYVEENYWNDYCDICGLPATESIYGYNICEDCFYNIFSPLSGEIAADGREGGYMGF